MRMLELLPPERYAELPTIDTPVASPSKSTSLPQRHKSKEQSQALSEAKYQITRSLFHPDHNRIHELIPQIHAKIWNDEGSRVEIDHSRQPHHIPIGFGRTFIGTHSFRFQDINYDNNALPIILTTLSIATSGDTKSYNYPNGLHGLHPSVNWQCKKIEKTLATALGYIVEQSSAAISPSVIEPYLYANFPANATNPTFNMLQRNEGLHLSAWTQLYAAGYVK
jgi:hypothetical protein